MGFLNRRGLWLSRLGLPREVARMCFLKSSLCLSRGLVRKPTSGDGANGVAISAVQSRSLQEGSSISALPTRKYFNVVRMGLGPCDQTW